jgi:tRNA-specific 2-thiouridylase
VVDPEGRVVGRHDGIYPYTVGQRKGIGVSAPWPLYVVRRETETNRLVVGPREALMAGGLAGHDAVWLADLPRDTEFRCTVKIRSTGRDVPCVVTPDGTGVTVRFDEPQFGVAPGQAAVFYRGDTVVGGAWIETALRSA